MQANGNKHKGVHRPPGSQSNSRLHLDTCHPTVLFFFFFFFFFFFAGNGTVGGQQTMDEARDRLATTATLVSALTIGCFFCLVAAVLVGKRVVDGWRKRHYSRIERDYLIDGMYHE